MAPAFGPGVETASAQAAAANKGRQVFLDEKCNLCHKVPSAGIDLFPGTKEPLAPSVVAKAEMTAAWLARYIRKDVDLDGKTHNKPFVGTDEELKAVVEWLVNLPPDPAGRR